MRRHTRGLREPDRILERHREMVALAAKKIPVPLIAARLDLNRVTVYHHLSRRCFCYARNENSR